MTQTAQVVYWEARQEEDGRLYLVVGIGPRWGVTAVSIRRELHEDNDTYVFTQGVLARRALVHVLREIADKVEAGVMQS